MARETKPTRVYLANGNYRTDSHLVWIWILVFSAISVHISRKLAFSDVIAFLDSDSGLPIWFECLIVVSLFYIWFRHLKREPTFNAIIEVTLDPEIWYDGESVESLEVAKRRSMALAMRHGNSCETLRHLSFYGFPCTKQWPTYTSSVAHLNSVYVRVLCHATSVHGTCNKRASCGREFSYQGYLNHIASPDHHNFV